MYTVFSGMLKILRFTVMANANFKCTYGEWYSGSDRGNAYAPFDQRFYLILNLAAGGTFDSGYVPDSSFYIRNNVS